VQPDAATLARAERYAAHAREIVSRHVEEARSVTKNKVHEGNVAVALHVRERGGTLAFGVEADRPLAPASNMKLVTSAAALLLLGPAWSFETQLEAGGPITAGVLDGALVVRAAGDPLYDPGGDPAALLQPAIDALVRAGLRRVRGDLVLDERDYQEPAPYAGWPDSSQYWTEYCALSGGFSLNRGCLAVQVKPGAVGAPARVTVVPAEHGLEPHFDVDTVAKGEIVVSLFVKAGSLFVRGKLPVRTESYTAECAHTDPVELFGAVLAARLRAAGIAIDGQVRRARGAPGGEVLVTLATPLVRYLVPINTDSINAVADELFLAMGQELEGAGSAAGGARATARALERLGVDTTGFVQHDGSGLSRDNRVTARQLTELLTAVLELDPDTAALFRDSLAVAGETGTLEKRMRGSAAAGRVRAKTGFIAGVSSLSGVVQADDGRELVFSVIVSYPPVDGLNTKCWKPMQDELCALLVGPAP